jgi:hypothetical protein
MGTYPHMIRADSTKLQLTSETQVWKSVTVKNTKIGFQLVPESDQEARERNGGQPPKKLGDEGHIGSASFIDSSFSGVGTAVLVEPISSKTGSNSTGVIMENIVFSSVGKGMADTSGKTLLEGGSKTISDWATGPVYTKNGRKFSTGGDGPKNTRIKSLLDGNGAYFERKRPQYTDRATSDFIHLKDLGAKGMCTKSPIVVVYNNLEAFANSFLTAHR